MYPAGHKQKAIVCASSDCLHISRSLLSLWKIIEIVSKVFKKRNFLFFSICEYCFQFHKEIPSSMAYYNWDLVWLRLSIFMYSVHERKQKVPHFCAVSLFWNNSITKDIKFHRYLLQRYFLIELDYYSPKHDLSHSNYYKMNIV